MDRSRRPFAVLSGAAVVAALVLLPGAVAAAAAPSGWLRLAHLSPDTKKVDVTLSSLSGGTVLYKLSGVGYGAVSPYMRLQPGTYAVAMVPADAPASADPVVNAQVTVKAGAAETLAALGRNRDIATKLYADDLDQPAGERARVKVVQASVGHDAVDVRSGSTALGTRVGFGDATSYATVDPGTSTLRLKAGTTTGDASVSLRPGSVHTVFVLDNAAGSLTATSVLDSAGTTVPPVGSVETGGGGLESSDASSLAAVLAVLAAAGGAASAAVLLRRRGAAQHA